MISPPKTSLPNTWDINISRNSKSWKKMDKRKYICKVRLTSGEEQLFKEKAKNYSSVSSMVRDAVRKFDNKSTKGKIDALNEMTLLLKKYQQELGWLGGNFNQTVKRANELSISQEITPDFFEKILFPQVERILKILSNIRTEQKKIARKLIDL